VPSGRTWRSGASGAGEPVRVVEVTPRVYAVHGTAVNWAVVKDGDDLTLVDAGYPGDVGDVRASLAAVGGTLRAVLVTHAHVDHIGGLPELLATYDVPVLASAPEAAHVRREHLEQAGPADVLRMAWRPRAWPWVAHLVAAGALRDRPVPSARAFPVDGGVDVPLEVPGSPVPVPTAGHTSGHSAYLVDGVLLTGDALVTGHPLSRVVGPQRLHPLFEHDPVEAERALDAIAAVDARALVPGHGPVHHGSPAAAVRTARSR